MIDHFNLPVSNLDSSLVFYEAVLGELGYSVLCTDADAIGFGSESWEFGLVQEKTPLPPIHLAFRANSSIAVQAFYRVALGHGARCNGVPGRRPHYGPAYYSAFVFDPDGHNLEAVYRGESTLTSDQTAP